MTQEIRKADATLTKEQIQAVINQKLENTLYWLNKAYDARPQDPSAEETLLEIMAELRKIKRAANESLGAKSHRAPKEPHRAMPMDSNGHAS